MKETIKLIGGSMKLFKVSAIVIAVFFVFAAFATVSWSVEPSKVAPKAANIQEKKPPVAGAACCPAGWHLTHGSCNAKFACAPNKPAPVKCPAGTNYFDTGCSVGCQETVK